MSLITQEIYEFGPYSLDAVERVLWRDGSPLSLTPKAFETLLILVRNHGRVLTKDELLQQIWPDTFVEEVNLAVNISTLRKALSDSTGGREYIETVPRRGYRFVASVKKICESPDVDVPAEVSSSSGLTALPSLRPPEEKASEIAANAQAPSAKRVLFMAGMGLLALFCVSMLLYLWARHNHQESSATATTTTPASKIKVRRSIAVLGFQNLSGRPEASWLSTALSEMLSTELAADGQLRTIPGEDIARLKVELPLADADAFSKATLTKIRKNLGTDYVVVGSYTALGGNGTKRIRLDLRLQDLVAGETIASVAETGEEAKLFELVTRAGVHLREPLGESRLNPADTTVAQTALPSDPKAARLYAEGLSKLRVWDNIAARDLLEQSIRSDSRFPLAHAALSSAWSALGYDVKAAEEAKKAFELSATLSREDRLLVEGRYRETQREWDNAIGIYRALYGLFPDNLDYGLRLVDAQDIGGHPKEALATIETLRKLPPLVAKDPRIDLAEARAAGDISDAGRELDMATKAAQKGSDLGARLIIAEARVQQGKALNELGKAAEAKKMLTEGKDIFESVGDLRGVANSLNQLAIILEGEGDFMTARQVFERFGKISQQIGDRKGLANSYTGLSELFNDQGDPSGALKMCEQALPIYKEIGERRQAAAELTNCGNAQSSLGNLHEAMVNYSEARQIYDKIGDKSGVALELHDTADVLADQGRLKEAKNDFEQALSTWQGIGSLRPASFALFNLGEVLRQMGDVEHARNRNQEALKLRTNVADKVSIAESQIALAEILLDEGRFAEATAVARSGIVVFQAEKVVEDETTAYLLQARAALAQKDFPSADKAVKLANQAGAKTTDIKLRLRLSIVTANVSAMSPLVSKDSADKIKAHLTDIAKEAQEHGFAIIEYEAQVALADAESQFGERAHARKRLLDLEKRAEGAGFGLIARKVKARIAGLNIS
jgi:eukaryotic-like serine/threonine-protein kinase